MTNHPTLLGSSLCKGLLLFSFLKNATDPHSVDPSEAQPLSSSSQPLYHTVVTWVGKGVGEEQGDPESCASTVFPQSHPVEAMAATLLWKLPFLLLQLGQSTQWDMTSCGQDGYLLKHST